MMQLNMAALAELFLGAGPRHARTRPRQDPEHLLRRLHDGRLHGHVRLQAIRALAPEAVAYELRGTGVSVTCVCPDPTSTGFAKAANMSGVNFFTLTKPATARQLAAYAYRMMMRAHALLQVSHQGWGCGRTPAPPRVHPTGRRAHERRRPTTASSRMNTAACGNPRGFHAMQPFPVSLERTRPVQAVARSRWAKRFRRAVSVAMPMSTAVAARLIG